MLFNSFVKKYKINIKYNKRTDLKEQPHSWKKNHHQKIWFFNYYYDQNKLER